MRRLTLCLLAGALALVPASCGDDGGGGDSDSEPPTPPERRGVVLLLERDSPRPGETLTLTVENRTRWRLEYGVAYRLESRTGDRWRWINRDSAFVLILKIVEPGKREREEIGLPRDLKPGRYRIVKSFAAPAANREIRGTVEFRVS